MSYKKQKAPARWKRGVTRVREIKKQRAKDEEAREEKRRRQEPLKFWMKRELKEDDAAQTDIENWRIKLEISNQDDQELPLGAMLTGTAVWLNTTTGATNGVLLHKYHGNAVHPCPALDMVSPDDSISAYLYRHDRSSIDSVNKAADGDESDMKLSFLFTCEAL